MRFISESFTAPLTHLQQLLLYVTTLNALWTIVKLLIQSFETPLKPSFATLIVVKYSLHNSLDWAVNPQIRPVALGRNLYIHLGKRPWSLNLWLTSLIGIPYLDNKDDFVKFTLDPPGLFCLLRAMRCCSLFHWLYTEIWIRYVK